MLDTSFIIDILKKHLKKIIAFAILGTIVGAITCLLMPKYYLSSSTVLPANPKLSDKNFVYGSGTIELTSAYGMEEDADRLLTQLRLSSNFSKIVDSFKLIEHYNIKQTEKAKAEAQATLVQNSTIAKTETGAIKVSVWDKDKNVAAELANALIYLTEQKAVAQNIGTHEAYINQLQMSVTSTEQEIAALSSISNPTIKAAKLKVLQEGLEKNLTVLQQFKIGVQAKLPNIIVLEKAYASQKSDKPKLRYWILTSLLASILFACCATIVLELMKQKK